MSPLFDQKKHQSNVLKSEKKLRENARKLQGKLQAKFQTLGKNELKKFHDFLGTVRAEPALTPHHFFMVHMIEESMKIARLNQLGLDGLEELGDEEGSDTTDIFDFWSNSDFINEFKLGFEKCGSDMEILDLSIKLQKLYTEDVANKIALHFAPQSVKFPVNYKKVFEFGDEKDFLFLGTHYNYVDRKNFTAKKFGNFILKGASFGIVPRTYFLSPGAGQEKILYQGEDALKGNHFFPKIQRAINIIHQVAPELNHNLFRFTKVIVPFQESGLVSYSQQYLPGTSCINFADRDFVDLMDDLIHENGHHHLNVHLNFESLIREDDDQIYYSPWRRSLRPVRGIYHATFTFYWAYYLFKHLAQYLEKSQGPICGHTFKDGERQKIQLRFLEEYHMVKSCSKALNHAFKHGKVTAPGRQLMDQIFKDIGLPASAALAKKIQSKLNERNKKSLTGLVQHLAAQEKSYGLPA